MNETSILPGFAELIKPFQFPASPHEFKVTALKECPTPEKLQICSEPDQAAAYWRMHLAANPYFNPECECLAVLILNTRDASKGITLFPSERRTRFWFTPAKSSALPSSPPLAP
jgi:hypothetical protein